MAQRLTLLGFLLINASAGMAACLPAGSPPCEDPLGCRSLAPGEALRIDYLLALSGPHQPMGSDALGGIEMALQERQGDLLGHPIELGGQAADCSREEVLEAALKIAADPQALAVIGPHCPYGAAQAAGTLGNAGLLAISLAAALPESVGEQAWPAGFFRLALDERSQAALAAGFARLQLGARRAATLGDGSPYSAALQQAFARAFEELGGEVSYEGLLQPGESDARPLLREIAADPPQVLYLPLHERQGSRIAAQAAEFEPLRGMALVGADGLFVDAFLENLLDYPGEIYLAGLDSSGRRSARFLESWVARYGDGPHSGLHALAFDATRLLLDTIAAVAVQRADGNLSIGRQALREAIASRESFAGVGGDYACLLPGDCTLQQEIAIFRLSPAEAGQGWPPTPFWKAGVD